MKFKLLTIFSSAVFLAAGCGGGANTAVNNANNANANRANNTAVVTATATPAPMDAVAKKAVEDALKKAGMNDVTVEATTTEVTLRGTVPKGKMADVNRIAQETGKRKVVNQVTEK